MKKVAADSFIKATIIRCTLGAPKSIVYIHHRVIEFIGEASEEFCKVGGSGTINLIGSNNYFVTSESCEEIMEMLRQIVTED